jgi:hypothetical protein
LLANQYCGSERGSRKGPTPEVTLVTARGTYSLPKYGEAGISPQHPQAIPNILKEHLDKPDSSHLAIGLLEQCHVSELTARGASGLCLGHPQADISLCQQAQMRLDLVIEFPVRSSLSQ